MLLFILVIGLAFIAPAAPSEVRVEVFEYFDNVHASTLEDARETCELRGGTLANDPNIDDWDNYLMSETMDTNVLLDTYFTVNVKKSTTGVWQYADGTAVDMTSTKALTLRELDSGDHGSHNYDCALWNPWEPFFVPSKCAAYNAFICSIPVTLYTTCNMEVTTDTRFSGVWAGIVATENDLSEEQCKARCTATDIAIGVLPCWAMEYDPSSRRCTLLRRDEKPELLPDVQQQPGRNTYLKNCKIVAAFEENTCSVLCKCNTENVVVIPTDKEEYEEFVEEAVKKHVKELTVPKNNLSASVRKKTSAKDERESSTGMGALGIALLTLVFGCLMALDLVSVCSSLKATMQKFTFDRFTKV